METRQTAESWFRWPRLRLRPAVALFFAIVGGSLLQGWALHASLRPRSHFLFVMFFSGGFAAWAALPILQTVVLNAPLPWRRPWSFLAAHLLGYACFTLFSLVVGRSAIVSLFALFQFDEPLRTFLADLLYEVQNSAPVYAGFALLLTAIEVASRQHATALREAALEAAVATSQFDALRARVPADVMRSRLRDVQLVMARDLQRAELHIEQLGSELRAAFASESRVATASGTRVLPPLADASEGRPPWPRVRAVHAAIALGVCLSFSVLAGGAMKVALDSPGVGLYVLAVARGLGAWLALPIPYAAVVRRPDPRRGWLRYLATHVAAQLAFVLLMTGYEYGAAYLAMQLLGQSMPAEATFWSALLFEYQRTSQLYVVAVMLFTSLHFWGRERQAERRLAQLEAKLAEGQLQALTARLEPHFLYNALNTVSALMHVDGALAERLLGDLDGLLHAALSDGGATWTLGEERAHTQRYVEFIEARFGDRIAVQGSFEPGLDHAEVPRFALQLLVENAVKHNQHERAPLRIGIEARKRGGELRLTVTDDGCGFAPMSVDARGSLRRLEQTLHLLHGARAANLVRSSNVPHGARIDLHLPIGSTNSPRLSGPAA